MGKKKKEVKRNLLTIVIGGNMEKDEQEIWDNPEVAMKQSEKMVYVDSYEQLHQLLSPARLDLLRYIIWMSHQKESKTVGTIANDLKRKQEAISRDLHYLSGMRFIELKKDKQMVLPLTRLDGIDIQCATVD
ncbi:MAG: hypothetical protein V1776_02400 [Candidatus Diapherotrites archaeon]